jgi:DnaJ family protein C protein 9
MAQPESNSKYSHLPVHFQADFYTILGVSRTANVEEIKRAYRRSALKYHPDHNKSASANEEFALLAKIHETLTDTNKRRYYDQTGEENSEEGNDLGDLDAYEYWRTIFPAISEADIETFRLEYINSAAELEDISEAYKNHDGDLQSVFESVPFADSANLDRIISILTQQLGAKYNSKQIEKFRRQWKTMESSEATEAEEAKAELLSKSEQKLLSSQTGEEGLTALIQARNKSRAAAQGDFFAQLESKYSALDAEEGKKKNSKGKGKSAKSAEKQSQPPALSDKDFEAFQQKLFAKNNSTAGKGKKQKTNE